jgi:hypothetical protein
MALLVAEVQQAVVQVPAFYIILEEQEGVTTLWELQM